MTERQLREIYEMVEAAQACAASKCMTLEDHEPMAQACTDLLIEVARLRAEVERLRGCERGPKVCDTTLANLEVESGLFKRTLVILKDLLLKVNKVTAPHRHRNLVSSTVLSNLSKQQLITEEALEAITKKLGEIRAVE